MPARLLIRSALAVVAVAGAVASFATYDSQRKLQDAYDDFLATPHFRDSVRRLRASDSVLNPSVYRDFGIATGLLKTGRPVAAERVMARSARRQPYNAHPWSELTRFQLARGRLDAARASWAHARRLNPNLPLKLPPTF